MSIAGCDIAWGKPTGEQLAAAGIKFACLYVGQDDTGKNMTPAVVADYAAHGVQIVTNFEYGAQQMLGGARQGSIDAALGWAQAKACGMPPRRPIIYSADWAATAAQITDSIIPYLVAARGVTGPGTVGVYGSYAVVTAVAAYWAAHYPGERIHLWQTVAWSNSRWDSADEITQTGGTVTVGGIALDQDFAAAADYGQWQPGSAPAARDTTQEDDMFIAQFNPDPKNPGAGSGIFLVSGGKLIAFASADTALAFKNQLNLSWVSVADGGTLQNFQAASVQAQVTVDLTDAEVQALVGGVSTGVSAALKDPALLAAEGAAIAHAEAVQQHNETPAA